MDYGMIGQIEKGKIYAQELERFRFYIFEVSVQDIDKSINAVIFKDGKLRCDCNFFLMQRYCPHTLAIEQLLGELIAESSSVRIKVTSNQDVADKEKVENIQEKNWEFAVERANLIVQEIENFRFLSLKSGIVSEEGKEHKVEYENGNWICDCSYFSSRKACSHSIAVERVLSGMVDHSAAQKTSNYFDEDLKKYEQNEYEVDSFVDSLSKGSKETLIILAEAAKIAGRQTDELLQSSPTNTISQSNRLNEKTNEFTLVRTVSNQYLTNSLPTLTPSILILQIGPYLAAISDIQSIINEILGQSQTTVIIKEIKQFSPVSVSMEGAGEAIQTIKETVVPWRRKHAETMAQLLEQDKLYDIECKKAEVLEIRARAAKERAEAERLRLEAIKQQHEADKLKLENEKLKLELYNKKIQLALEMINQIAPNLSEAERIGYLVKILPPLEVLVSSNLEISN